jgi:ABC-type Fe3+-siderophore transport system permease subunit
MLREQVRVAAGRLAPQYVDIPFVRVTGNGIAVVGCILQSTVGNWLGEPTTYAYQWKSNAANVGTNSANYTTVAGDSTHSMTCVVSATNANGTTAAPASNAIVIP